MVFEHFYGMGLNFYGHLYETISILYWQPKYLSGYKLHH